MKWFTGSINDAVATSKSKKAVFVVFAAGQNEASIETAKVIDSSEISSRLEQDDFVAVKLDSDSESYNFFAQIYKVVPVPSLFFIGTNGAPIEIIADDLTVSNIQGKIDSVLEKVGNVKNTSNDFIKAEQNAAAGNIAGPSTSVAPSQNIESNKSESTTLSASDADSASKLQEQDKIERARKLIEIQRKQKMEKEKEEEKRRELERRKMGRDVQTARQKQQELEIAMALEERAKEKALEYAAKERVRQQIAQDKLERKQREQALQQQTNQQQAQERSNAVSGATDGMTRIQFRLPSGSPHLGQFQVTSTLRELHSYVTTNIELPFREFTMSTSFPRRDLSAEDDSKTLTELELVPTAVVLILPLRSTISVVTSGGGVGILSRFMWTIFSPVLSVYNYLSSYFTGAPVGGSTRQQNDENEGSSSRSQNQGQPSGLRNRNLGGINPTATAGANIHRLHSGRDDNDENNTWNGNSTQQM